MKIVNIIGGLGNQMFQYAFYLALQKKYEKEQVYIDIHHFREYGLHNGFELEAVFNIQGYDIASKNIINSVSKYIPNYKLSRIRRKIFPVKKTEYIEQRLYEYDDQVFQVQGDCYYEGYWQSLKYFNDYRTCIIKQFAFKGLDDYNLGLSKQMQNENSVCIHVRRGDYVEAKMFKGICELEYYRNAVSILLEKQNTLNYYIFSNDIDWCKDNLSGCLRDGNVSYISHNKGKDSYRDMFLMSSCNYMIIANSSFSWWAAYLNTNPKSVVIAPAKWANVKNTNDILHPDWIKL